MNRLFSRLPRFINIKSVSHFVLSLIAGFLLTSSRVNSDSKILDYEVDCTKQRVELYWKNDDDSLLRSLKNLKNYLGAKNRKLVFAMNGGMYQQNQSPLELFVQKSVTITPMNTRSGNGNFYLKPNRVFYITKDKKAGVCTTENFSKTKRVEYATQSGPMLVINGEIHPAFAKGSKNLNIRNGVGLLANGHLVFAMSKEEINFYDFAMFFKNLGCKNALYLDGFVSRMYLPEKKWEQSDGNFGVMIGVSIPDTK